MSHICHRKLSRQQYNYYYKNPKEFGDYNLLFNNCESFAFYCKTSDTLLAGQSPFRMIPGRAGFAADVLAGLQNFVQNGLT